MDIAGDKEDKTTSPRYGLPKSYSVLMEDNSGSSSKNTKIHWSRVLHIADNRLSSEVYGEPRMKPVYNNLLNVRKISGGSAEMFWRAGMSGTAWGLDPDIVEPTTTITDEQKEEMRDELQKFYDGIQRYLFAEGLKPQER